MPYSIGHLASVLLPITTPKPLKFVVLSKLVLLINSHLLLAHFDPPVSKLVMYQHEDSRRIPTLNNINDQKEDLRLPTGSHHVVISKLVLLINSHLLLAHFDQTVSKLVTYQHEDSQGILTLNSNGMNGYLHCMSHSSH